MKYRAVITDGKDVVPGGLNTPNGNRECASKCLSTLGCNSWTFSISNNSCYLKSDEKDWKYHLKWDKRWDEIGMKKDSNWISGSKACGSFCKYPSTKSDSLICA